MYSSVNIERILFVDIETVPQSAGYDSLDDSMRQLWDKKANTIARYDNSGANSTPADLYERAGIYAEFGKVVCVSAAFIRDGKLYVKSYS
jgi:ABC-type tungstate transport system permease subunit